MLFEDGAGFGRINKPKYCWYEKNVRPSVLCHHIRKYRYAFGAAEPLNGNNGFLVLLYCYTICMNVFLRELSKKYAEDEVLPCCDSAAWQKSKTLFVPENIHLFHIPPYTQEMNPIEQIWRELRKMGFRNEVFSTFNKVVECLCYTIRIRALSSDVIRHITARKWIINALIGD